ncbi:MAG: chitobiase/beta-hexosaminidase C-terminal domain-containing protein, partial [Gaiellaceae bacterium]
DALSDNTAPFESDVYTWTNAFTSSSTIAVTLHLTAGAGGGTRVELIQPLVDTTDPTASDDTGSIGNDWKSTAQTVTLSPADGGSGVAAVHYTTDGSTPTTGSPSGTTIALNASGVYTIKYLAIDNVGNASDVQTGSTQIRIDLDDPANSFTATSVSPAGTAFVSGTDVWYRGGAPGGSFALQNNLTDAHSGPASTAFPALAQAEWTKSGETVTTPYVSSAFTRTAAASGSFTYIVTGTDVAGNAAATTLTFREDSTAPATGDNYGSIGSTWYSTPQTLTLTPDDGAGSGVGATFHSLDGGANYTPGSSVTLSATGVYNVTFYSVDNVGNAETPPRTVGPIRIDATAPTNSISVVGTSPAGSAFLSGTTLFYSGAAAGSFQLQNALPALDSGPFGTTFGAVSAPNWTPKAPETVTTPAGGPYTSSAFSWTAGTADFALTATGEDNAGNTTDTVLTVTDDSTPPLVSDDTASITDAWRNTNATVTLTASDSSAGVADVYYRINGGAWTPGTSISLTATGVYTIEYYAVDNVGNASAVQTGAAQIRIDKINPSGAVTDPAPGATLSGTAAQVSATGSDTISGIASVQFQVRPDGSMGAFSNAGLPVTMPPYDATWDTTTFANGDYELRAFVTDLAGNTFATATRTITVDNVPAGGPLDVVIPAGTPTDTVIPVPGTANTVTVPGGSNSSTWVIRTEERIDLESTPPAGSTFGGDVVEVTACVAGPGVSTVSVPACLSTGGTPLTQLPVPWTVRLLGAGFPARSGDGSGWSELTSYAPIAGGYDLSVSSLSFFTLLVPQEGAVALTRPNLVGVVQYGLLKLRWSPSGGVSPVKAYELFVDGKSDRYLGERQYEEILGEFTQTDTRVFELRAVDIHGRVSPLSNAVTSVPELMGMTVAEARAALAARGFAGVLGDSFAAEGDTVVRQSPAAPALATVGGAVTLVTSGGEGHAALRLQVSNSLRIVLGLHTLNVRVALTAPATVSAKLFSRDRFVRTKTGRLVRWETFYKPRRVEAGATIVPFRLLRTLTRPGGYVLLVTARSPSGGSVTQSRTPITVVRPAVQRIVVGQARVDVPVTLVQPSVVTVQLVSKAKIAKAKTGKRVPWRKIWSGRRVESGTTILSLPLPRSLTRPGAYRLVVTSRAVATGKVTRRQLPVTVVRKASPEAKSVDVVVLTGKDVTPSTPLKPDEGVKISQADDADQVFTTTSTPSANVQVIVIDVGGTEDVELIRQLRLVYPDLKIIAVVPQGLGAAAREAGATIVVMKPASPELISTLINQVATNGSGR